MHISVLYCFNFIRQFIKIISFALTNPRQNTYTQQKLLNRNNVKTLHTVFLNLILSAAFFTWAKIYLLKKMRLGILEFFRGKRLLRSRF